MVDLAHGAAAAATNTEDNLSAGHQCLPRRPRQGALLVFKDGRTLYIDPSSCGGQWWWQFDGGGGAVAAAEGGDSALTGPSNCRLAADSMATSDEQNIRNARSNVRKKNR